MRSNTHVVHSLHHLAEFGKIERSTAVNIDLVDEVVELLFGGILTQCSHGDAELLQRHAVIAVLVE